MSSEANLEISDGNPDEDITLTLEQLENCSYLLQHKSVENFDVILARFDEFYSFLDSTLISSLHTLDNAQKHRVISKFNGLLRLMRNHVVLTKFLVSKFDGKSRRYFTFVCSYCGEHVAINKEPFWETLQDHEHFELLLTDRLVAAAPDPQIETNKLQNGEQFEDDSDASCEGFKFNFLPCYDDRVKNVLYPSRLIDVVLPLDDVADYTVQNRCTAFFCLLCKLELSSNVADVVSHVTGADHKGKLLDRDCMKSLNIYHSTWLKISPICQSHQVFFVPDSVTAAKCLICDMSVNYDALNSHIKEDDHKKNVFKSLIKLEAPDDEQKSLTSMQMEVFMSSNQPLENSDEDSDDSSSSLSSAADNPDVSTRTESNSVINITAGDSLVKDARTVSTEFGFLRVEEILSSDDQSDDDSADKQDECRKFTSEVIPHRLNDFIYPDKLRNYFQKRGPILKFCLICVDEFLSESHFFSEAHLTKAQNESVLKNLEAYRNVWETLPAIYWVHQIFFDPATVSSLSCRVCQSSVDCKKIEQHIKDPKHLKSLLGDALFLKTLGNEVLEEMFRMYRSLIEQAEDLPQDDATASSDSPEKSTLNNLETGSDSTASLPNTSVSIPKASTTKMQNADRALTHTPEAFTELKAWIKKIDILMSEIYPDATVQPRNMIQYRGRQHFCLVCQCYIPKGQGKIHTQGQKHIEKDLDERNQQIIEVYYNLWVSIAPVRRVQIIFFDPFSTKQLHCWLCKEEVDATIGCILTHLYSTKHYNFCKVESKMLKDLGETKEICGILDLYLNEDFPTKAAANVTEISVAPSSASVTVEQAACFYEFTRLGANYYYITANENNTVFCRLCSVNIPPKIINVSQHLMCFVHSKMSYYLLPNFDSTVFCVPCERNIPLTQKNVLEHLKKHSQCVLDPNRVIKFWKHKGLWSKIPPEFDYQKICFRLVDNNSVHCIACNNKFKPTKLLDHILRLPHQHLFEKKHKALSKRLTCLKDCDAVQVPMTVTTQPAEKLPAPLSNTVGLNKNKSKTESVDFAKVQKELCPKALRQFDGIVQSRGNQSYCLLCRCDVPLQKRALDQHIAGKLHLSAALSQSILQAFKAFSDVWKQLPPVYWAHQIFTTPNSSKSLHCDVCTMEIICTKNNTQQHVDSKLHRNSIAKSKAFLWHLENKTEIGKALELFSSGSVKKSRSTPCLAAVSTVNKVSPSLPPPTVKLDLCFNELMMFGPNYYYIIQSGNMISCRLCFGTFQPTISNVTQHFNGMQHSEVSRYLIPNHDFTVFCMVCALNMPSTAKNVSEHLKGAKHKSCESNVKNLSAIEIYEHSWSLVPDRYHYQQICFRMANDRNIECLFCCCKFDCTRLFEHILGVTHEVMFEKRHTTIARLPCLKDCNHRSLGKNVTDNEPQAVLHYPAATPTSSGLQSSAHSRSSSRLLGASISGSISELEDISAQTDVTDSAMYQGPFGDRSESIMQRRITANQPDTGSNSSDTEEEYSETDEYYSLSDNESTSESSSIFDEEDLGGIENVPSTSAEQQLGPPLELSVAYHPELVAKLFPLFGKDEKFPHLCRYMGKKLMCLQCSRKVTLLQWASHCKEERHKKHDVGSVIFFHKTCMQLPLAYQAHTTYLVPLKKSGSMLTDEELLVGCRICKIKIDYNSLKRHINSQLHKQYFLLLWTCHRDHDLVKEDLLEIQIRIFQNQLSLISHLQNMNADKTVFYNFKQQYLETLNSSSGSSKTYTFVIERHPKIAFCLPCRYGCPFDSRTDHLQSRSHLMSSKTKKHLRNLEHWKNMPYCLQKDQIHFIYMEKTFRCLLCRSAASLLDFRKHLKDEDHIKRLFIYSVSLNPYASYFSNSEVSVTSDGTRFDAAEEPKNSSNERVLDLPGKSLEAKPRSAPEEKPKEHKIVKAVQNQRADEMLSHLENRHKIGAKYFTENPNNIYCKSCDVFLAKNLTIMKEHLLMDAHMISSKVVIKKYRFNCDICGVYLSKEKKWMEHLISNAHKKRVAALPQPKQAKMTEYECLTCNMVIFGDDSAVFKHQALADRNRKKKEVVLPNKVKELFKSEEHINKQAMMLVKEARAVIDDEKRAWDCCKAFEVALSSVYPNCRAYPFGSRVSGLGNQQSDLDVFVDTGDMYLGERNQDAASQENIVITATKLFRKNKTEFSYINPVPTARTPIVQVYHKGTNIDCDLSFRHGLSVENTKFLRVCINIQPYTQHMILLLKKWSASCKLNEPITTYALSMMTIFYLQTQQYLIPVTQLAALNPGPGKTIYGWSTITYKQDLNFLRDHVKPLDVSLKQLLQNFFSYYAAFPYETEVICPLLGHTIPKNVFNVLPIGKDLPPAMSDYVKKIHSTKNPEHFRALTAICVQDPFDLSHNLTKACQPNLVTKLKKLCDLTVKHLQQIN